MQLFATVTKRRAPDRHGYLSSYDLVRDAKGAWFIEHYDHDMSLLWSRLYSSEAEARAAFEGYK